MSSINRYGVVIDYKELIETLYDVGIAQCVELRIAHARTPTEIELNAHVHFRGKNYGATLKLSTDALMSSSRNNYLHSVAHEIARLIGDQMLFSVHNE